MKQTQHACKLECKDARISYYIIELGGGLRGEIEL